MQILATSRVNVFIPIDPPPGTDPTLYQPQACLHPDDGNEPAEAEWQPATWIGGEVALLVGPGGGGHLYPPGDYMAYARILGAGLEQPTLKSGRVRIGE